MALCITRKIGESIQIGRDIEVKVADIRGSRCRIAITAPRELDVLRTEVATTRKGGATTASGTD